MPLKSQDPSQHREAGAAQGAEQGPDKGTQKSVIAEFWFEVRHPSRDSKFKRGNVQGE